MPVIHESQRHARTLVTPSLDHARIDEIVCAPLPDACGTIDRHRKRVISGRILIETELDVRLGIPAVVEDAKPTARPPFVDAVFTELAEAVAAKIQRGRQEHQPIDAARVVGGGRVERDERAETRPDERDRAVRGGGDRLVRLGNHARHGQRREVGLIEVRTREPDLVRGQFAPKTPRLGGGRRRRESVKVDDVADGRHNLVAQSGRQRH